MGAYCLIRSPVAERRVLLAPVSILVYATIIPLGYLLGFIEIFNRRTTHNTRIKQLGSIQIAITLLWAGALTMSAYRLLSSSASEFAAECRNRLWAMWL